MEEVSLLYSYKMALTISVMAAAEMAPPSALTRSTQVW